LGWRPTRNLQLGSSSRLRIRDIIDAGGQ